MTPINHCSKCHGIIQYAVGPTGKSVQVNPDGTAHSCQIAAQTNGAHTEPAIRTTAAFIPPAGMNGRPVIELPKMQPTETIVRQVSVRPDSLEIGTPGKNGALKIYMDFADPADCEQRIRTAVAMRELANQLITAPMEMVRA